MLRDRLIRLAHSDPELRPHLLPLLREAAELGHVPVQDLPDSLRRVLRELKYGRRDIRIESRSTFSFGGAGGDGYRDFTAVVNMETGAHKIERGSWGGANAWSRPGLVDSDAGNHPIPDNGAVIKGTEGGGHPTYAYIIVGPQNVAQLIPERTELPADEREALNVVRLKSGYRAEYFTRQGLGVYGPTNPLIVSLAKKGLVKVTATGIAITTAGKNALGSSLL